MYAAMEHSRKKSCKQCRVAKTRCDLKTPTCARCEKKRFACKYEKSNLETNSPTPVSKGPYKTWLVETRAAGHDCDEPEKTCQEEVDGPETPSQPNPESQISLSTNSDGRHQNIIGRDSKSITATIHETRLGDRQAPNGVPQPLLPLTESHNACSFAPIPGCSNAELLEEMRTQNALLDQALQEDSEMTDSMTPESTLASAKNNPDTDHWNAIDSVSGIIPNILNRKKVAKLWQLTSMNYIWANIKMYPVDFGQGKPSPFIHNSYYMTGTVAADVGLSNVPEALANFRTIAAMYSQKTVACNNLVLNSVFNEVNRLNNEVGRCDDNSRLESLQALAMFVIVLASDGERCNLLSIMTRIAMGEMARKLVVEHNDFSKHEKMGEFPTWAEWIFAESCRRSLLLLHLMDQVLDFNVGQPNISGCRQFDKLPLTCSKKMWEAQTSDSWTAEYKRYLSDRKGSEVLRFGDLRKSSHLDVKDLESNLVSNLSIWANDVDSFGSLILSICH